MPNRLDVKAFPSDPVADYASVRGRLQNGDVLICSGTGIFSTMIQGATESVWSHVGLILRVPSIDRVMLLESVEPVGVRTIRLSKYLDDYDNQGHGYPGGMAVIRHEGFGQVPRKKLEQLTQFAVDQFGYPYDKTDIAAIAARILAARVFLTRQQRRRIPSDKQFICSEYVYECFLEAGLDVEWNGNGFIAPANFAADPRFGLVAVLRAR